MELSQFSDYALRTLIFVALREERTSVREIADSYQISHNHLVKVVHHLAKLGLLKTTRGRGGGVALGPAPEDINVGDVIRKTESFGLVECLPPREGSCCIAPACELKFVLAKAKMAFLKELNQYTLADLIQPRSKLQQLLAAS